MTASATAHAKTPVTDPHGGRTMLLALAVAGLIGYGPLLWQHFTSLWAQPYYQYFPFVLLAFGYLLFQRSDQAKGVVNDDSPFRNGLRQASLVLGWLLLLAGVVLYDPWLAMLSAILVAAPLMFAKFGSRGVVNLFGIWCLLWLLLPPPRGLDQAFISKLQVYSSIISSHLLDLLRIDHLMTGNVLRLPEKQFFVDEACSGIVSVMSVIACGAIYCVWSNRSLLHSILLICLGIGWAVLLNVTRISVIAISYAYWDLDLSEGAPHDVLGLVLFMVTFAALMSSDQLLAFLLQPIAAGNTGDSELRKNPMLRYWNRISMAFTPGTRDASGLSLPESGTASVSAYDRLLPIVCIAFGLLGISHIVGWGLVGPRPSIDAVTKTASISEESMSDMIVAWERISFQTFDRGQDNGGYGEFSKSFQYANDTEALLATASIDYPYRGSWHELTKCYSLSGWNLESREVKQGNDSQWKYIEAKFTNESDGQHALLLFSMIDDSGELLSPPANGFVQKLWQRWRRRGPGSIMPVMTQVQVWSISPNEFDDAQHDTLRTLFSSFRTEYRQLLGIELPN